MIVLLMLAAAANPVSQVDVLSEMRAGKVMCSNPDLGTKTCSAITSYSLGANGELIETGEVLLSHDQPVTLETSFVAHIENGAVCAPMDLSDLEKGKVRVKGTLLPPDRNAAVVSKIVEKIKPLAGRKVCETLRLESGQLLMYGHTERVDIDLPGTPERWIAPEDGFKVAPRQVPGT